MLIRQDDYRPFLLALYALTCCAADSGNRYAPEDALIPGGRPLQGLPFFWSAVVNSTLQATLGLRWLLCYEETDEAVCHLQKAAPRHWFIEGKKISVKNCPTRFGSIGWSTQALSDRRWKVAVAVPRGFSADLIVHIHPRDAKPLRSSSQGSIRNDAIVLSRTLFTKTKAVEILVS